ncbi:MAG: flagellar hook-basal body protein [Candidatus Adiutricales bacterium]
MELNSSYSRITGSISQEHRLNIISNNLANVSTPGFKKDVAIFENFIITATKPYMGQGHLIQTGGKFDLGLRGPGFFQIETPRGLRYTRDGSFTINAQGSLVTQDGNIVLGETVIPSNAKEVAISPNGEVTADGESVGTIELIEFADVSVLEKEGHNFFKTLIPELVGEPARETTLEQGYLEMSNVNVMTEMIGLIETTRTYEAIQKMILTYEEVDSKAINEIGRLV